MKIFKRPRIGVTGPDKGGTVAWVFTAISVLVTGGFPIRIRPGKPKKINGLEGLIIGGGADVEPDTYQQKGVIEEYLQESIRDKRFPLYVRILNLFRLLSFPIIFLLRKLFSRKSYKLDKARDSLEFNLLDQAIKKNIPVLGICRGAQLINVYFKGTLYEEIEPFYIEEPNRASLFPIKTVQITKGSKLNSILQVNRLTVNALHHQAVKKKGENILITAKEDNGIVQAIEATENNFVLGVQWHPEFLIGNRVHRRLFTALITEAEKI